jgi:SMP-30/Gluconolactonase/LRE-like region
VAFTVGADGKLGERREFARTADIAGGDKPLAPDGLKTGAKGNLYIALYEGAQVLVADPSGKLLATDRPARAEGLRRRVRGRRERALRGGRAGRGGGALAGRGVPRREPGRALAGLAASGLRDQRHGRAAGVGAARDALLQPPVGVAAVAAKAAAGDREARDKAVEVGEIDAAVAVEVAGMRVAREPARVLLAGAALLQLHGAGVELSELRSRDAALVFDVTGSAGRRM